MHNIKITTYRTELINSGFVFSHDDTGVSFDFGPKKIDIVFADDESRPQGSWDVRKVDNITTEWVLYNYNSPSGNGWLSPKPLGDINGERMFMSLWISKPSAEASNKKIEFVFYKQYIFEPDDVLPWVRIDKPAGPHL